MRAAALAVLILIVILIIYIAATGFVHDHHARWLERHDKGWDALSSCTQARYRQEGLLPSWEMTDARLRAYVGDEHLSQFRHRHPAPW